MNALYDIGDVVRLTASFTVEGVATDPDEALLTVLTPELVSEPLTPLKTDTGRYRYDYLPQTKGTYHYRWEGTGAAQSAEEGYFKVRERIVNG